MTDALKYTEGSGSDPKVDTDEVTRGAQIVHQQVVKISLGADGASDLLLDSGQQLMAASLPVVLASDQSALPVTGPLTDAQLRASVVPISDGGGSLTVDGPLTDAQLRAAAVPVSAASLPLPTGAATLAEQQAQTTHLAAVRTAVEILDNTVVGSEQQVDVVAALPAGDNAIGRVKITDGTDVADVLDLTNSNPLVVALVDANGTQIVSFGGGTQYTEGDTDASITGIAMLWEDTADTLRVPSAAKPLPVNVVAGGTSGTEYTEDVASVADPVGHAIIARRRDTLVTNEVTTDGDNIALNATNKGQLHVAGPLTNIELRAEVVQVAGNVGADIFSLPAIPTGDNAIGRVKITDGTDVVDVLDLTNSNPIAVAIVDAAGTQIASFGGGTQYTEGDTDATIVGTAMLWEDTSDTLRAVSAAKPLPVQENGAALAALQLIDDGVATTGSAIPAKGMTAVGTDGTNARAIKTDASGELQVDVLTLPALVAGSANIGDVDVVTQPARVATTDNIGAKLATDAIMNGVTALTPKFAIIDHAGSGDNTLVAAVSSKKIRVLALFIVAAGTVTARFESGAAGTALTGQMNLVANSGFTLPFNPVGWFETAATTLLNLELSGAVSVDGALVYVEV